MENPRPEKVAVVAEVKAKLSAADAVVLTDYRGINVAAMSELRRALRLAGGEYKIYKNSLVRFAARELDLELDDLLLGPTAIAFIPRKGDGTPGDPVMVAKALRDFARTNEYLVVKGGLLGDKLLSVSDVKALAEVALCRPAGGHPAQLRVRTRCPHRAAGWRPRHPRPRRGPRGGTCARGGRGRSRRRSGRHSGRACGRRRGWHARHRGRSRTTRGDRRGWRRRVSRCRPPSKRHP